VIGAASVKYSVTPVPRNRSAAGAGRVSVRLPAHAMPTPARTGEGIKRLYGESRTAPEAEGDCHNAALDYGRKRPEAPWLIGPLDPCRRIWATEKRGATRCRLTDHCQFDLSCNPALAGRGRNAIRSIETTRGSRSSRRGRNLAARGARAAADGTGNRIEVIYFAWRAREGQYEALLADA
jgi:hypothetical protein